jgi:sialic acid synthase SpsE
MLELNTERLKILTEAHENRQREVMHHQINIDNYTLAIAEIESNHTGDANLAEFASRLRDLLASSKIEQVKETIMRDVIAKQVKGQ